MWSERPSSRAGECVIRQLAKTATANRSPIPGALITA
jgi:hypothetical protein